MIHSTPTPSGAVVDKRAARTSQPVVEADAGREAEETRQNALAQPRHGTRPVALQGEQVLAGPEDRLDALADGRQVRALAGLVGALGAHHGGAEGGHGRRELTPGAALVAEQRLTAAAREAGQQFKADLALVARGRRQGESSRGAVGRAEGVQRRPQNQREWAGAVAVADHLCE